MESKEMKAITKIRDRQRMERHLFNYNFPGLKEMKRKMEYYETNFPSDGTTKSFISKEIKD